MSQRAIAMTARRALSLAMLMVAALAVATGTLASARQQPEPKKFDHDAHVARDVAIANACDDCHAPDPAGKLVPVGGRAHQPCLQAGCHVRDFLRAGKAATQPTDDNLRAAGFCLGCHASVPRHFQAARADAAFRGNDDPDFHVELDHYEHTERAKCRDCHRVDERSFALELSTPGHAECAVCHGPTASPPMTACGNCHETPGPAAYFAAEDARPATGVRSCDSDAHRARVARHGGDVPCFAHEREEHRFQGGKPLQCDRCHYMLSDESAWTEKHRYASLRDIHTAPLIDARKNEAHERCGDGRACHARDVSGIDGNCTLCHSRKVASDIF